MHWFLRFGLFMLLLSCLNGCAVKNTNQNNRRTGTNLGFQQKNNIENNSAADQNGLKQSTVGNSENSSLAGSGTNSGAAVGTDQLQYRNGVYMGEGNRAPYGKERAYVTIRQGKITDIRIVPIDERGKEITGDTYPDTTSGNLPESSSGRVIGSTTRNATGIPRSGVGGGSSLVGRSRLLRLRTDIISQMLLEQSPSINPPAGTVLSPTDTSLINNWKLAVRRALDKASAKY